MTVETMSAEMKDLLERWPMGNALDLPRASTCIVAGAYKGAVMELLDEMYSPERIVGFEPQRWAFEHAWLRVSDRTNCLIVPWGLGAGVNGLFPMAAYETDECSFVGIGDERGPIRSQQRGTGRLVEMRAALDFLRLNAIDLAVLNMEGYEYILLPYMIEHGIHRQIDRFAVQFHPKFGTDETYRSICTTLDATHDVTMDDFPRWVLWRRR